MTETFADQNEIASFGDFILANRDEITRLWVTAVDRSPDVQASEDLTYRQLLDHLPQLCTELAHLLQDPAAQNAREETVRYGSVHGAKRWQQGYRLEELIREISLLRKEFMRRWFEAFETERAPLPAEARRRAKRIVHRFFDDVIIASTSQFVEEQQERLREAEALLLSAKERAEAADEAKNRFISLMSHELRTPLTPVLLGAAILAHDKTLSPEHRELARIIAHNTRLEAALVDDLLDASKLTHEPLPLNSVNLDVHACLTAALEACAYDFELKQISPQLNLMADPARVLGDHARLVRTFSSLFRNAASLSPKGGGVIIQTRAVAAMVEISIEASAVYFEPESAGVIFLPFEEWPRSPLLGSGMGLSRYISKATIEAHHGTLSVSSAGPGGGTIFLVRIPIAANHAG